MKAVEMDNLEFAQEWAYDEAHVARMVTDMQEMLESGVPMSQIHIGNMEAMLASPVENVAGYFSILLISVAMDRMGRKLSDDARVPDEDVA